MEDKKMFDTELHIHLEGVTDATLLKKIYDGNSISINLKDIKKLYSSIKSFDDFIGIYTLIVQGVRKSDDIMLMFDNIGKYFGKNGITYSEILVSPTLFTGELPGQKQVFSIKDIIQIYEDGAEYLIDKYNVEAYLIIDGIRGLGPEPLLKVLKWLEKICPKRIIGISLGGQETSKPPEDFTWAFSVARATGLHCLCHLGEFGDAGWIQHNLKVLLPERIGHGINACNSPALLDYIITNDIGVDMTITGNLLLGALADYSSHPLRKMIRSGVAVTLNSDDPGIFNTGLCQEVRIARSRLGLTDDDILTLAKNSKQTRFKNKK